jgi:glycosyltransferase involved in cell wall biosynthesis
VRVWLENVNLESNTGPNSFAQKLIRQFEKKDIQVDPELHDASLCFIESFRKNVKSTPTIQRLDGIYFNTYHNYELQNSNIFRTYKQSEGVVFQSEFNKRLILKWFGDHKNHTVIHNGADLEYINSISTLEAPSLEKYKKIWCCAARWRPHKRLGENINYFLEHSGPDDVLFIAGDKLEEKIPDDHKIKYLGVLQTKQLVSLYKASDYFVHLAWLDHCPNVVVDARACGCKIICTNSGGTKEISGPNATIVQEEPWDFRPAELYSPPPLDFSRKVNNSHDVEYDMSIVAEEYINFLKQTLQ